MRSSVLLALASGLLTYALPTAPDTSLIRVNGTLQWTPDLPYPLPTAPDTSLIAVNATLQSTPDLPYPAGYSPATCPLDPGPNPWSTLEAREWKERSLTTATHLRRRNPICEEIAHGSLNHFKALIYGTQEVLLVAGARYVFTFAMNRVVLTVNALRHNPDGTQTFIEHTYFNAGRDRMTLNIDQTAPVSFLITFVYVPLPIDISGEIALFQIDP